jgi:hypothetical protein
MRIRIVNCNRCHSLIYALAAWLLVLSSAWSLRHAHQDGGRPHGPGFRFGSFSPASQPIPAEQTGDVPGEPAHSHLLVLGLDLGSTPLPALPACPTDEEGPPARLSPADTLDPPGEPFLSAPSPEIFCVCPPALDTPSAVTLPPPVPAHLLRATAFHDCSGVLLS